MYNLVRANLLRIRKDILLWVAIVLIFVFTISSSFSSLIIQGMDIEGIEALGMINNGKTLFIAALNPLSNMGFLTPIILLIMFAREYTNGTLRNKVIAGYSRTQIYGASYISFLIIGVALTILNMILSIICGTIVIGYGTEFNMDEMGELMLAALLGLLVYLVFLSIAHLMFQIFENFGFLGHTAVVFLVGGFGAFALIQEHSKVIKFITRINPMNQMSIIQSYQYSREDIQMIIISSLAFIILINTCGVLYMNKKSLK